MPKSDNELTRREFLTSTACVAAGAAIASALPTKSLAQATSTSAPAAAEPAWSGPDVLAPRKMGRVGFAVPAGGYGAIRTNEPALAAAVFDKGFYFVHSSPGYTGKKSYEAIREMLKDKTRRDKIVLALKIGPNEVDRDLEYFGIDHIDIIVPPKDNAQKLSDPAFISQAEAVRKAGKVRGIGWACHSDTIGTLNFAAEAGVFDAALIGYRNSDKPEFIQALKAARAKGLGVFAMKSGCGPGGSDKVITRMKWLLSEGLADSVLLSFSQIAEIAPTLAMTLGAVRISERWMLRTEQVAAARTECSWCNACADGDGRCPNGVAIPLIMRYDYYLNRRWNDRATEKYAALASACRVSACTNCGACERMCPTNLPVRKMLADAHRRLAQA